MLDNLSFNLESDLLSNNSKTCSNELEKMTDFFKTFITTHQEEVQSFQKKLNSEKNKETIYPSILLTNLIGIYNYFEDYINNVKTLMNKINNELINPLKDFSSEQLNIYKENIYKIKNINENYKESKDLLDYTKYNYYKISYKAKNLDLHLKNNPKFKGEHNKDDSVDLLLIDKMMAKNAELFYKYELIRYNKNINEINLEYNDIIDKIQMAEKSRIYFIKASIDKYRNFMNQYNKYLNNFIVILETLVNDEICQKDEKYYKRELSKFINNKTNTRVPIEKFIPFNDYYEENKDKIKKNTFDYELNSENKKKTVLNDEKEFKKFINELLNSLLGEEEINQEQMAKLYFLMKSKKIDGDKLILDCLLNLKTSSSIKFINLKNMNHLSNIISYITLKNSSILEKNFELNFKIIFISEKIYYQNKINNNKVYLSALLSKNKYYRSKLFWRSIMEVKLAHKLSDHIERLKKLPNPEEKKKGLFSKLGNAMGITNTLHKTSLLSKSRILPLIKDYYEVDESKVPIIDKMMIQEMQYIIKDSIPNLFKFNFPANDILDFLTNFSEEYKIPNELFKFLIIYGNVSSYTIIKQLPDDEAYNGFSIINFKKKDEINRKIKLLYNSIPYLTNLDFNNLLLCSKQFNIKFKKKIYSYILKQKNLDNKIRLMIWKNILGVAKIKEKYDYKVILCNAHHPKIKNQIQLDMSRTVSSNDENKEINKTKVTNILYAVSEVNGDIQYCQGMNYIGQFLYEVFGEEEAFYLFVGIFHNTEYSLIIGKDLQRLNIFFYVFKRILSLFEPELASYLKSCGVDVNFFLPPWFITLFTGSHHFLKPNDDNTKIILRIMDCFITFGWKAMMVISCAVLHSYENTLINMTYDDMMQFLINDILKSDFFSSKNEENIKNITDNVKISKKLIKNIEDEYNLEKKMEENNKK